MDVSVLFRIFGEYSYLWSAVALVGGTLGLACRSPRTLIASPIPILGAVALLSVLAIVSLVTTEPPGFRISLDPSEEPMLAAGDPARDVYRSAVLNFGDDDLFVVGMTTPTVFTSESLAVLRDVGQEIRKIPGVRKVESLVDATDYRYDAALDMVEVDSLIDDIPADAPSLERLKQRATTHPLHEGSIVSRDGRTAALNVAFQAMTDGEFVKRGIDHRISAILAAHAAPDREFFVTGRQHIKSRAHRIMVHDLLLLIPLAVIVGALVGWWLTGGFLSGILPVVTSLVATLWVFGLLAWLGSPLNLITVVLGPTLICVGSVYGVHVMSVFRELAEGGLEVHEAAVACVEQTRSPVVIAGVTTCVGFAALCYSDTPAVQQLGGYCFLGVLLVTLLGLTALPALLGVLPSRAVEVRPGVAAAALTGVLEELARVVPARTNAILVVWAMAAVAAVVCIPRIVVDSDYLTFFDVRSDVRLDFASTSRLLVGAVPLYVTIDGGREGVFRDPENLRAIERLQQAIQAVDGVHSTKSVVDLVRVANRVLEKDDPRAERIPDSKGEVADVLFLIPKNDLRRFATSNHSAVNVVVRTGRSGSAAILQLEKDLRAVAEAANLPAGLHAEVTGNAIVVNHGAEGIARNQLSTVTAASLAILLIVSRAFGSLGVGLLAMIPNLVPVAMFFGVLGAGVATLSLPTSLISCIALGIAIDDTAHFLIGYRRKRSVGLDPEQAVSECIRTLGRPIVTTSLMLVAGFSVLSLSGFATLREFGFLTALTMLICLGADLVLLPAILLRARV